MDSVSLHGGNREALARRLGCRPEQLLDASASLVPFGPPWWLRLALTGALRGAALTAYPDRQHWLLRQAIAHSHGLDASQVCVGNGAAELFTWVAREAADAGCSLVPAPGFADYTRALSTWRGAVRWQHLPLRWSAQVPQVFPDLDPAGSAALWITNPHNPTGQLWCRSSLEPWLKRFALVVVDEAFLSLVPGGEQHSLIAALERHPNLVVIRSLTKLLAIPGLRLGYALGDPSRLQRWQAWRDPWPVNGLALAGGLAWFADAARRKRWQLRVQRWVQAEGAWLHHQLSAISGLQAMPSAANYLLIRGLVRDQPHSLQPLREALAVRHRILVRDCRSFEGLDDTWLRLGYQSHRDNHRLVSAIRQELAQELNSISTPASS